MSDKVKYYVGKLSVSQIPLSMKLSGNLVMSHWKSGLRMFSNNIKCLLYQPGLTIDKWHKSYYVKRVMFRRRQAESNKLPPTKMSLLQSVKRYHDQYQSIIWKSTNEPISSIQLLDKHVGDDYVTFMFLL